MTVSIDGSNGVVFNDLTTQNTSAFYGGLAFRNRIINGAMVINQRGVTSGLSGGYFVDRWQITGLTTSSLITSSLPNNFTQAISINRTSAAGTMTAYQPIEAKNCYDLVGQSVTLGFWAQNVTGLTSITANLSYANTADNFSAITSISTATISSSPSASWTYYTTTFTNLPSGAANGLQAQISGVTAGTGTLGITGVQLEKGSTATSFDYRPYGTELALCQRYSFVAAGGSGIAGAAGSATGVVQRFNLPVPMRSAPTAAVNTAGSWGITDDYFSGYTAASFGIGGYSSTALMGSVSLTGFSSLTTGRYYGGNSSGTGAILFSSEL